MIGECARSGKAGCNALGTLLIYLLILLTSELIGVDVADLPILFIC